MSDEEYCGFKILEPIHYSETPLELCLAQNYLIIKQRIFFVLSSKYQLDQCALHPQYNTVPGQIRPCARLDVHWS